MKETLGTIFGFLIGISLITFGIIWPDQFSNYYVYKIMYYEDVIETLKSERRPRQLIKEKQQELEDFKNSLFAAISRFLDLKSLLIVFGGSYAAILIAFPFGKAIRTFIFVAQIFSKDILSKEFVEVYYTIINISQKINSGEIITDEEINAVKVPLLKQYLQNFISVDLVTEEMIREIIHSEIEMHNYRAFEEIDVLQFMGKAAPAFGMVGTVVGLILMLSRAGGEGGSITDIMGSMSVALITTLYGVLIAQLIFIPVASKRYQKKQTTVKLMEMIQEGIIYLKRKELPEVIAQDMIIYLPKNERIKVEKEKANAMKQGNLGL